MKILLLFISVLACFLIGDLATGFIMTLLHTANPMQQGTSLDQTYLFYVITALIITSVVTIFQKSTKKATR